MVVIFYAKYFKYNFCEQVLFNERQADSDLKCNIFKHENQTVLGIDDCCL